MKKKGLALPCHCCSRPSSSSSLISSSHDDEGKEGERPCTLDTGIAEASVNMMLMLVHEYRDEVKVVRVSVREEEDKNKGDARNKESPLEWRSQDRDLVCVTSFQ